MTNLPVPEKIPAGDIHVGLIEAVIALGVALSNAGLVSREQIAAAMAEVMEQQAHQDGKDGRPARKAPASMIWAFFASPVIVPDPERRFTVVEGGRSEGAL